jgi:transcription-repair coupling factor (superfamily II helicase)
MEVKSPAAVEVERVICYSAKIPFAAGDANAGMSRHTEHHTSSGEIPASTTAPPLERTPQALATAAWLNALRCVEDVNRWVSSPKPVHLGHVMVPTLKALLLKRLYELTTAPVVMVLPDAPGVLNLYAALEPLFERYLDFQQHVYRYPTDVFSPYDLSSSPAPILSEHLAFVQALQEQRPGIFLLQARNLVARFPSMNDMRNQGLHLKRDSEYDIDAAVELLMHMGYTPKNLALTVGDFSRRGDLLDIYPVNAAPVRISFFGDTVESIRAMDVETQRSVEKRNEIAVFPLHPLVLGQRVTQELPQALERALAAHSKALSATDKNTLDVLSQSIQQQIQQLEMGEAGEEIHYYAPLLQASLTSLVSCIPEKAVIVLDDWQESSHQIEGLAARWKEQYQKGIHQGLLLSLGEAPPWHEEADDVMRHLHQGPVSARLYTHTHDATPAEYAISEPIAPGHPFHMEMLPRFQAKLDEAVEQLRLWRKEGYRIWVSTDYPQRLLDICREAELPTQYWPEAFEPENPAHLQKMSYAESDILICKAALHDGVLLPELKLVYLTDAELFGRGRVRRTQSERQKKHRKDQDRAISALTDLKPGDYVVHFKHGIGQFIELKQIAMDKERREYLEIQYKGNDRLFLPVEQLHLLSRFNGTGDVKPALSKMGGAEWKRVTKKVKQSIQNIANELVALYKARRDVKGMIAQPDTPWQVEMEEAFPFEETPDQWQAIIDTKKDMETPVPMDRLICGDVGFGKTEVALRALFKAIMSGRQSAFLVPTTILAQQHFNTVQERLAPWGVRVGLLSRFRSPREQKELLQRLKVGEVDVVVGTHRLLQKDVYFKDLGLLVIDEEHRFGLAHKERIKHMRTNVDVLSMSATPIPRTLHMSLSGVREMSLINTPPVNRLPVQTRVGPFNPAQLRMAILHELDRGGQIYYLHNRVQSIYQRADELERLVPEAKVRVAHGQMSPGDLETAMLDFATRQYDVLVATTIIESGVDIPNANTLIIDDADRYGLAQLYQIRGRVGRSDVQAYAYLYHDTDKLLTEDAKNRLRAIREFTALGSGYQIAMRDMEIRGVGNLLGAEQHGHMMQIGFEMYCELLNQAVEAAHQGLQLEEDPAEPAIIDLNITAFIPENYVGSRDVKLQEYRRLAATKSETQLDMILAEWQDRFGPVPEMAKQLLHLARLRIQATVLNIPLVRGDDESMKITVPFGLKQWMALQDALPKGMANKLRWVAPARAVEGQSLATLQYRHMGASGERLMQFTTDLFQALLQLQKSGKLAQGGESTDARHTGGRGSVTLKGGTQAVTEQKREKAVNAAEARTAARQRAIRGF